MNFRTALLALVAALAMLMASSLPATAAPPTESYSLTGHAGLTDSSGGCTVHTTVDWTAASRPVKYIELARSYFTHATDWQPLALDIYTLETPSTKGQIHVKDYTAGWFYSASAYFFDANHVLINFSGRNLGLTCRQYTAV